MLTPFELAFGGETIFEMMERIMFCLDVAPHLNVPVIPIQVATLTNAWGIFFPTPDPWGNDCQIFLHSEMVKVQPTHTVYMVIAHEMVHHAQYCRGLPLDHGKWFRDTMARLGIYEDKDGHCTGYEKKGIFARLMFDRCWRMPWDDPDGWPWPPLPGGWEHSRQVQQQHYAAVDKLGLRPEVATGFKRRLERTHLLLDRMVGWC